MRILVGLLIAIAVAGCSNITGAAHYYKSTDRFVPLDADSRVFYEPGAEEFAREVAKAMPHAVARVEAGQYLPFKEPGRVQVCVCATKESFHDMTGRDVRAIAMRKVFLSPRLMERPDRIPAYLAHELSHMHLMQRIAPLNYLRLPFWFTEGLATFVSGGGGAQEVGASEAIEAIKAGKRFEPNGRGGIVFRKTPGRWGLKPQMFYRQAMLFMDFLKDEDEESFRNFILGVQNGDKVDRSFEKSFGMSLAEMWKKFVERAGTQSA